MPAKPASAEPRGLLRDSLAAARRAHLRYVSDGEPGIERRGTRGRFWYLDASTGRRVNDRATLERIRALALPPAWQRVWICRSERGHLQATGHDARGRKQYRYHAEWRALRDRAKYSDIVPFARALPRLRRALARDFRAPELSKARVLATAIRLLEHTRVRVGNERYAQENHSYGLTTLRTRHVRVSGGALELRFRGKSGQRWSTRVNDRELAAAVQRCRALPGSPLFQYVDERGRRRALTSADVNAYLHEHMGSAFSAKEFRTWSGTLAMCTTLFETTPCTAVRVAKRALTLALERVASELGNTKAVCRRAYVDPLLFDCYLAGDLHRRFERCRSRARERPLRYLARDELAVILLLESLGRRLVVRRARARYLSTRERWSGKHDAVRALAG